MTWQEIFDEVKMLSKRGDVDDRITSAIRKVTLYAHRLDYFWRDRIEAQLAFRNSANQIVEMSLVEINVLNTLPRFRAVNYMRYWDPTTFVLGRTLDPIEPRAVLDDYHVERVDYFYTAGDILKIKFRYPSRGVQIGFYCSPVVHPVANYASWIATQFPDLIIQAALADVYNSTGKTEEANMINREIGIIVDPGRSASKGPTLIEQLKQYALEEGAR